MSKAPNSFDPGTPKIHKLMSFETMCEVIADGKSCEIKGYLPEPSGTSVLVENGVSVLLHKGVGVATPVRRAAKRGKAGYLLREMTITRTGRVTMVFDQPPPYLTRFLVSYRVALYKV